MKTLHCQNQSKWIFFFFVINKTGHPWHCPRAGNSDIENQQLDAAKAGQV
jgi:hypothetical protein